MNIVSSRVFLILQQHFSVRVTYNITTLAAIYFFCLDPRTQSGCVGINREILPYTPKIHNNMAKNISMLKEALIVFVLKETENVREKSRISNLRPHPGRLFK